VLVPNFRGFRVILRAERLSKLYTARGTGRPFAAVRDVSLELDRGEILGIVGESGCGKSTLARMLVGLEAPTTGTIELDGLPLADLRRDNRRLARRIQMVFQDPYAALNPRLTVGQTVAEVLTVHRLVDRGTVSERVGELLEQVGLPSSHSNHYPHELSGGQQQRVGIARALALQPGVIVLDEPVSALDVSVRAQVINLLTDLRTRLDLSYVFISHDLGMVRQISDRVAVMYLGQVVEYGDFTPVLDAPLHPYTHALAAAVPTPDPAGEAGKLTDVVTGEVPDPVSPPSGCAFHPRCPAMMPICTAAEPELVSLGGRLVSCHLVAQGQQSAGEERPQTADRRSGEPSVG
jgi:oligopeptide/dipeptide ABC transporter ATP-binding protein